MSKDSAWVSLQRHFDKGNASGWLAIGLALGVPNWIWGASQLPAKALVLASGFSWLLIVLTIVISVLSVVAHLGAGRIGRLALGDFTNLVAWALPQLLRAASVFIGVALIALTCWFTTGNRAALATGLYGFLLAGGIAWCWGCLSVTADTLLNAPSQVRT